MNLRAALKLAQKTKPPLYIYILCAPAWPKSTLDSRLLYRGGESHTGEREREKNFAGKNTRNKIAPERLTNKTRELCIINEHHHIVCVPHLEILLSFILPRGRENKTFSFAMRPWQSSFCLIVLINSNKNILPNWELPCKLKSKE